MSDFARHIVCHHAAPLRYGDLDHHQGDLEPRPISSLPEHTSIIAEERQRTCHDEFQ
jgi:hypothetical protein